MAKLTREQIREKLFSGPLMMPPKEGLSAAGSAVEGNPELRSMADRVRNFTMNRDPDIAHVGTPHLKFRAAYAMADNDDERQLVMQKFLGPGGGGKDIYGNDIVTPAGQAALGIDVLGQSRTINDPRGFMPDKYDLADAAGAGPTIAGSIAGGAGGAAAGSGFGPVGTVVGGVLGAAGGGLTAKGGQEGLEGLYGYNLQAPAEVAEDMHIAAGEAGVGELTGQLLRPIGRFALGPNAHRMNPARLAVKKEAESIGIPLRASQVLSSGGGNARITARVEGMLDNIFGNTDEVRIARGASREAQRIRGRLGKKTSGVFAGQAIRDDVKEAHKVFHAEANARYGEIDDLLGNTKVVPTQPLKDAVLEVIDEMESSYKGGAAIGRRPPKDMAAAVENLRDYLNLDDYLSFHDAKNLRTRFGVAVSRIKALPDMSDAQALHLYGGSDEMFKQVDDYAKQAFSSGNARLRPELQEGLRKLEETTKWYGRRNAEFANSTIKRVLGKREAAGTFTDEALYRAAVESDQPTQVARLMKHATPATRKKIRRHATDNIVTKMMVRRGEDPLGVGFKPGVITAELDRLGETARVLFDKQTYADLRKLDRALLAASSGSKASGGLVAAGIALHPFRNMPLLVKLKILKKAMASEPGRRYLTVGLSAPNTRMGVMAMNRFYQQSSLLNEEGLQND